MSFRSFFSPSKKKDSSPVARRSPGKGTKYVLRLREMESNVCTMHSTGLVLTRTLRAWAWVGVCVCACGRMSHAICMRVWHVNHWTRQPSLSTFSHIPLLSSLPSCPLFSPNIVLSAIRTCSKVLPPRVALLGARAERAPCDYSRARYVLPHLYIPSPHPLPSTVSPRPLRGKRGARLGARASLRVLLYRLALPCRLACACTPT